MINTFFIPLNSKSLAHYFGRAIVLPSHFYANKPTDIQNKIKNGVLITNKKWVQNCDCSIEIVLTKKEKDSLLNLGKGFFVSKQPIPISRIKSVYFHDKKQQETTIWNINSGAAFVPSTLIQVEDIHKDELIKDLIALNDDELESKGLKEKIVWFDKLLGGLAFLKIAGKFFMNYSENYFSTLAYFNLLIQEQLKKSEISRSKSFSYRLWDLIDYPNSEWSKWQNYFLDKISITELESLAKNEGIPIEKRLGMININSISKESPIFDLAILSLYGENKSKSTFDLVIDLSNGVIPSDKGETISFLFGLHIGYSKLHNSYKTHERNIDIKYKMDSILDYYTVESIYQYVFNDKKENYKFDYIDEFRPAKKSKSFNWRYKTYRILDVTVIDKKKETLLDLFMQNYSKNIYEKIVELISQWLPPFVKKDSDIAINYFRDQLDPSIKDAIAELEKVMEQEFRTHFEKENETLTDEYESKIKILQNEIDLLKIEINNLEKIRDDQIIKDNDKSNIYAESSDTENQVIIKEEDDSKTESGKVVENSAPDSIRNLESLNVKELREIAKQKGIKNSSKMKKEDLIRTLRTMNHDYHFSYE